MTESAMQAVEVLRNTENMKWYVVPLLVFVLYIYVAEIERRNWSAVFLGVSAWATELIWEMFNAGVLHFSGHAPLWGTPGGDSALVIYAGLNIEISLFFAAAGVMIVKSLPPERHLQVLGIPNRVFVPAGWALVAVFVEVLLNRCGLLTWDYGWWGWPHVWLIVAAYGLFFFSVAWCHDHMTLRTQKRMAVILPLAALACHLLFASVLGWV
jgi:hypothetical protein